MQPLEIKQVEREHPKRQKGTSSHKSHSKNNAVISDSEVIKILEEVDRLIGKGQTLECINLLRALKDNMQAVKSPHLGVIVIMNLGILYYQVGLLEEANQEFTVVMTKQVHLYQRLRQLAAKVLPSRSKDLLRIRYETILSKVQLQACILFSELGKHDIALDHAQTSSKICYNLIYDLLARLHLALNRQLQVEGTYKPDRKDIKTKQTMNTLHNIAVLNHLLNTTKDLKLAFLQKERQNILEEQTQLTKKYGFLTPKIDLERLYDPEDRADYLWIYKNKILDEIQLMPFEANEFDDLQPEITNNEVIEKITYLSISLYCFSTQTRFIEKQKQCDSHDVLDSEHWLSRSLEIAYSFLPPQAPILNQIITVHDRFHGLDKQTIPEDEEVTGFFKVLKPLSKPKSTYSSKNPGSSPIMIRIQADKVDVRVDRNAQTQRELPIPNFIELEQNKTIDLESLTRNNKIRNYSHGNKRIETSDPLVRGVLSSRTTIDVPPIHNPNIRTNYASKKFGKKKEERLRVNLSQLNGKAIISQDLLSRPHSLDDKNSKSFETEGQRLNSERRKKSLPTKKNELTRKSQTNQIKFEGLELKGHKMEDTVESDFFERLHQETKVMEAARLGGGNVYINNNINLFISRQPEEQTFVRGQLPHNKNQDKDLSRRQIFLNKRRANNFMVSEE